MDLTTLAQWLHASSSYGMFLKASGTGFVATRANADPSKRPTLTVIDTKGVTTVCACAASAVINPSTAYPVTGDELSLGAGGALLLEFDLDSVPNPIASATLTLTMTRSFSSPLKLQAFALRSAKLFDGGAPTLGVAAKYTADAGILADPSVYFATLLDTAGLADYFVGAKLTADATFATDPLLGVPALGLKYHVGEMTPFVAVPDHTWSRKSSLGLSVNPVNGSLIRDDTPSAQYVALGHPHSPSELYFRYYLKLKTGYQCTTQGKKLPGLAGRYGNWTGTDTSGYYSPTAGNGGSPTKGTYDPADGGFSGWSMRHHAFAGPPDANPYADMVPLNYYAYHAKMTDFFGDMWRWGNPAVGYVNLEQDRWYCLEHYVKVNDVVGPFDALGNGTGVENGVVRGWIDGVLVFEKTDAVLRKHPAIKIDEVWLDHYHGGTTPAEAEHPFQMAALVVANSYIGPMQMGTPPPPPGPVVTPAWLKSVPFNQWYAIPGTELSASTDLAAQIAAGLTNAAFDNIGFGKPRQSIFDFSGGSLKSDGSEMLVFGGGGAGAWAGNEVRGLRLEDDAPRWKTRTNPTRAAQVPVRHSTGVVGDPTSPYNKDGTPVARHSYAHQNFIDATNTFMTFSCRFVWQTDQGQYPNVDSIPLSTGVWNPARTHPDIVSSIGSGPMGVCKHPVTEHVYVVPGSAVHEFNPFTNTWSTLYAWRGGQPPPSTGWNHPGVAAIDTARNLLVVFLAGGATDPKTTLVFDLTTRTRLANATLTGPFASSVAAKALDGMGLVYDAGLDKFIYFQDDGFLYTITRVSPTQYSVGRMSLTGTPPAVLASGAHNGGVYVGVWSRMQYIPRLGGVCIIQAYNRPAYFVRTA